MRILGMLKEKNIILTARVMSMVFMPYYLPVVGLVALFFFSYMNVLPGAFKAYVLLWVYLFTVLLPTLLTRIYRRYQGWKPIDMVVRERRLVPYLISILCYFLCIYLLAMQNIPRFVTIIIVAALVLQMLCALINVWWKISMHTAAIGGFGGALVAFAEIFAFNPTWWFCIILLLGGVVGSSRMILRQHTLAEVVAGFALGFFVAYFII